MKKNQTINNYDYSSLELELIGYVFNCLRNYFDIELCPVYISEIDLSIYTKKYNNDRKYYDYDDLIEEIDTFDKIDNSKNIRDDYFFRLIDPFGFFHFEKKLSTIVLNKQQISSFVSKRSDFKYLKSKVLLHEISHHIVYQIFLKTNKKISKFKFKRFSSDISFHEFWAQLLAFKVLSFFQDQYIFQSQDYVHSSKRTKTFCKKSIDIMHQLSKRQEKVYSLYKNFAGMESLNIIRNTPLDNFFVILKKVSIENSNFYYHSKELVLNS